MNFSNKEIAQSFSLLGKLLELHGESPFKTKAYENAYRVIRSHSNPLMEMTTSDLLQIPGIGKAIADKITELKNTGEISALSKFKDKTPPGVIDILNIKGLGAKKVYQIWQQLGIESVGELLYACNENRLVSLSGFGDKTQQDIAAKAQFFLDNQGSIHYAKALPLAELIEKKLIEAFPEGQFSRVGALRRQLPVIENLEFLGTISLEKVHILLKDYNSSISNGYLEGDVQSIKFKYYSSGLSSYGTSMFHYSTSPEFVDQLLKSKIEIIDTEEESSVFESLGINYIIPQRREIELLSYPDRLYELSLLSLNEIKGVIHAHSTYSDGAASLKEMADACKTLGYEYLLITDHSKAAFYANGLTEKDVLRQWDEIDQLNANFDGFKIFKGIECDILSDGSLDYENDILAGFDCVIASIHSVLKMDIDRATSRIIKAIENPFTRILGHPTGRLLLSRAGYPIDHKKVIDAAAANNVVIEINANPYRLDLDWTWIPYALEKNVMLSINPDAHSVEGIKDIQWGIPIANKGGALSQNLLCCMNLSDFNMFVGKSR